MTDKLRAALQARDEVLEAYLFGSVARGQAVTHSDVDVAVFVEPQALERPGIGYDAELTAELAQASISCIGSCVPWLAFATCWFTAISSSTWPVFTRC